jgi:hypothetical protein
MVRCVTGSIKSFGSFSHNDGGASGNGVTPVAEHTRSATSATNAKKNSSRLTSRCKSKGLAGCCECGGRTSGTDAETHDINAATDAPLPQARGSVVEDGDAPPAVPEDDDFPAAFSAPEDAAVERLLEGTGRVAVAEVGEATAPPAEASGDCQK